MKKFFLSLAVLALTFSACKKDYTNISSPQARVEATSTLPNLYIVGDEKDWYHHEAPYSFGLVGSNRVVNGFSPMYILDYTIKPGDTAVYHQPTGTIIKMVRYDCTIGNKQGSGDFTYNRKLDGYPDTYYGGYDLKKPLLSVSTFQNSLPIATVNKQNFAIFPYENKLGFDWNSVIPYGADTSYLYGGTADVYGNLAPIRQGKQVIVVTVNPNNDYAESDTTDNSTILPLNVIGTSVTIDSSALLENRVLAATNFTAKWTGKTKTIALDWDCPYHAPFYVKHWFTLYRDGVKIADNFDESNFTDKVNNPKHTYQVTITVQGLGTSAPVTVRT